MEDYLEGILPNYKRDAEALWKVGIRSSAELAEAEDSVYKRANISEPHVSAIRAFSRSEVEPELPFVS